MAKVKKETKNPYTDQEFKDWTDYIEKIQRNVIKVCIAKIMLWDVLNDTRRPDYKFDLWVTWRTTFLELPMATYKDEIMEHLHAMNVPARVLQHMDKKTAENKPKA